MRFDSLSTMLALAAELVSLKVIEPPTRAEFSVALPAELELLNAIVAVLMLVMFDVPAVAELLNWIVPLLPMVDVPAGGGVVEGQRSGGGIGDMCAAGRGAAEEIRLNIVGDMGAAGRAGVVELQNAVVDDRGMALPAELVFSKIDESAAVVGDRNRAGAAVGGAAVLEHQRIAGRDLEGLRIGGIVDDAGRVDDERIVDGKGVGLRVRRAGEEDFADPTTPPLC